MTKINFCVNCGKYNHIKEECFEPITSYGIILFNRNKNNDIKYLCVRRKVSHNFMEFMIGKYDLNDISFLNTMFSEMTINERWKILNLTFENLWNDLWGNARRRNKFCYNESEEKYNKLKTGFYHDCGLFINLEYIVQNNECNFQEPEWGFPKGKRNFKEKNLEVALREFSEETNLNTNKIKIITSINSIYEVFTASNNKKYKHIYYVACSDDLEDVYISNENENQIKEIGDIKWFSLDEIFGKLRNCDIEKKKMIKKLNNIISSKNFDEENKN